MAKQAGSAKSTPNRTWATMDGSQKAVYIAKVCIMLCSFGFIFGGVLVEGMTYEPLP